jgi:hypothetical protein
MTCSIGDRSGVANGVWGNTRKQVGETVPIWKDPNLVLDYHSFWNKPELFVDYVVQPQPADVIAKYKQSLMACTKRIQLTRTPERAAQIIQTLEASSSRQLSGNNNFVQNLTPTSLARLISNICDCRD